MGGKYAQTNIFAIIVWYFWTNFVGHTFLPQVGEMSTFYTARGRGEFGSPFQNSKMLHKTRITILRGTFVDAAALFAIVILSRTCFDLVTIDKFMDQI